MSSGIYNRSTGFHNRRSIRLRGFDYSQPGAYFITICVQNPKQRVFGDIVDGGMAGNDLAEIVRDCWHDLAVHYPYIRLDEFVIMPMFTVLLLFVNPPQSRPVDAGSSRPVGTGSSRSNFNNTGLFGMGRDDHAPALGNMVAYFKYQTTKRINAIGNDGIRKIWQRNYFDRIIRDDKSMYFIRKYIRENPLKWTVNSMNHLSIEERETSDRFIDQNI